jgi:hypothetical protein
VLLHVTTSYDPTFVNKYEPLFKKQVSQYCQEFMKARKEMIMVIKESSK